MAEATLRLEGRRILVTGVSRPMGIGATLARRLCEAGAAIAMHGYSDYDMSMGHHSATENGTLKLEGQLRDLGLKASALTPGDLARPGVAEAAVEEAASKLGGLDGLVLNHAYSTYGELGNWTPEHIDTHLIVNVRASMMMIQSFAAQANSALDNAITLFTSGQYLGPMTNEIAYCVSKDAIICLCRQTSYLLGERGIRVNCVNPGPNDTGYAFGEAHAAVADMFPSGRWGTPEDTADLVLFLHSDYAKWITGQIIASEGGFRRG